MPFFYTHEPQPQTIIDGLTLGEAASAIGLYSVSADQLIRGGRLPFLQTPVKRLLDRRTVDAIAQEREEQRQAKEGSNDIAASY